ncbi:CG4325 [Drosophila busckii]|uniref:CG4325 n=1 Tax=Drosophila busckii TaxID=30019 RepID=A0A0M5JDG4_DROBS|nr:E3 ubiquitin-protein ligase RNF128 [Drosophila busckii]ALC48606.1 CG4325 [Drosophila busckii]
MSANRTSSSSNCNSRNNNNRVSCTICSEQYKEADNIYAGTCGHVFHWSCLQRWFEEARKCPICRCRDADYFQIYLNFDESAESHREASSSSSSHAPINDFENMLYEERLYREEINYLNSCIENLSLLYATNASDSD